MAKKTTKGFGELAELGKGFVAEVKKQAAKAGETAVESITGVNISNEDEEKNRRELEKLTKEDNKDRGPQIAEQRKIIAHMQQEEQSVIQQEKADEKRKIINLEEERRMREAEQGKMPKAPVASGKKRKSILPFRRKASTTLEDDIPKSVERINKKIA